MDIKETKEAVAFACSLITAGVVSWTDDGKLTIGDLTNFIDPLKKMIPAIEGANLIIPELKDLSKEEVNELMETIGKNLGVAAIEDVDDVLAIVKNGIDSYKRVLAIKTRHS